MEYKVKSQEGMTEISEKFGMNDLTIWKHANNKVLRKKRPDLNNLLAGDKVFIPEKEAKSVECAPRKKHSFTRKGIPAIYRIQLFKEGKPRANQAYTLDVDGTLLKGTTSENGVIEEYVPASSRQGKIILHDDKINIDVLFGALGPSSENIGIQQRLMNLGYDCGEMSDTAKLNEKTKVALKHFQTLMEAEPTGILDEQTREAIVAVHDSVNSAGAS